jgi:acetoin:2,6-dichlorophenolindophenol oxidoreductase subunit alpha
VNAPLDASLLLEMHRRMVRIRRFEEAAVKLHKRGEIPGAIHTSIGQEAAVVGACLAVRADDTMTGYHRSHGHPIAKGAALGPLMAELLGRAGGVCKGKGGSMHLADFSVGSLGESGIVGAAIPIATGAGLSAQIRGTDQLCLCFFGEGASNQGTFHESLNMAAIWNLPVIYVCENNRYAATTPIRTTMSVPNVADRAVAYGIPGTVVDGQDPVAVHHAVTVAAERARAGGGPSIVEALTYRYREHAEGLRLSPYRSAEELAEWQQRDPVALFRSRLIDAGHATMEALDALDADVVAEVEAAVRFARESPVPEPAAAFDDYWASPVGGGAGR